MKKKCVPESEIDFSRCLKESNKNVPSLFGKAMRNGEHQAKEEILLIRHWKTH